MPIHYPDRPPLALKLADDVGMGWGMGTLGGGLFHSIKGFRNSPRGEKLAGAWMAAKVRGPVLGGNFAVWGALFSASDAALAGARGVNDSLNAIMAGAVTGGLLAGRAGFKQLWRNSAIGAVLLGVIEGLTVLLEKEVREGSRGDPAAAAGHLPSPARWKGLKSYFRLPEQDTVPLDAVGAFRRFRYKWDAVFGPWATQFVADPVPALWSGWYENRRMLDRARHGDVTVRKPLPKTPDPAKFRVARERHLHWERMQAERRARKPGEPEPGYTFTPPTPYNK